MKKWTNKAVAIICVLALLVSNMVFAAGTGTTLTVGTVNVQQGTGIAEVDVPITLAGNTGLLGLQLEVSYANGLSLKKITLGNALSGIDFTEPNDLKANPITLPWDGLKDADASNGVVATLTFEVSKTTVQDFAVSVKVKDAYDADMNDVSITTINGSVAVTEKPKENFTGLSFTDATYTYDGTAKSLKVTGVPSGAEVSYTSADFDGDGKAIDEGTYKITATVSKEGYIDWTETKTLTIERRPVQITGIKTVNRAYNGTNIVEFNNDNAELYNAVDADINSPGGEEVLGYCMPNEGTIADANVGNGKKVTPNGKYELVGSKASNYVLTPPTGFTVNITKAPLTVTAKEITIRTGAAIPEFDETSYTITSGQLFGEDKLSGKLATNCTSTVVAKDYTITKGTLTAGNNYNLTFVNGKLSVVDKAVQNVKVDGIVESKTYGDDGFKITVTPDETSKLDNFTITSSNENVATVDASGNVTIKNAGSTTLTVKEAGNDDYATFTKSWTLTVDRKVITVTAIAASKKVGTSDPAEFAYTITGDLVGEDAFTGKLTRQPGETIGKYNILQGNLKLNDNYKIIYVGAIFEIVDKTPQTITVGEIGAKTYGDVAFDLSVSPDATSKLDAFTYTSSDETVATVDENGSVTIKAAGKTTITVSQAGNDEYAKAEAKVELVVNPRTVAITALNLAEKTLEFNGVLEEDKESVTLDFDSVKTTVKSSSKDVVEDVTTVTTIFDASNFKLIGDKAVNYIVSTEKFEVTVSAMTVTENLTKDENVTIVAAPVNDKTIIVTEVTVAPESDVKKIIIDATTIADSKVNAVAIPKTAVDAIVAVDPEVSLELTLKDGSTENKESKIVLNAEALTSIQTAESATLTISVAKREIEELEVAQQAKVEAVSDKTPFVYSLNIIDEEGNSVATSFGIDGKATVTLPYEKPAGNGNVIVKFLDDLGNLTNISGAKYDQKTQTVTIELGHFSEYLIYTEPVVQQGGGAALAGETSYTVKFETNGVAKIEAQVIEKNGTVKAPSVPDIAGYIFEGWYTDKAFTNKYDFTNKVTKSFTLYAKWVAKDSEATENETPKTTGIFADIFENDWFVDAVKYAVNNKLMNGVAEDKFAPNDTLTRAMLVTILYRNEGEPTVNRSIPFGDVDAGSYYANAVVWAQQNGIVNGTTETTFAPDANITREQIAAIMHRYAQYKGYDVSVGENTNILSYQDAESISEYAVASMQYVVGSGLIKGKTSSTLNPQDNATRAEIAAILQRFLQANK